MKFYEFGDTNNMPLMLLHGSSSTWELSFGKVIPILSETFHVIAVGTDGLDPADDSEFISFEEEAKKIEDYVSQNLYGTIYAVYATGLGCGTALTIYFNRKVKLENLILDGAADLSMGPLSKPLAKLAAKTGLGLVQGRESKLMMKLYGVATQEDLDELIHTDVTLSTLKNTHYASFELFKKLPKGSFTDIDIACWYGSKELLAPSGARELRKRFPNMQEKIFRNYTQGEILQHPEQMLNEVTRFLTKPAATSEPKGEAISVTNFKISPTQKKIIKAAAIGIAATATLSAILLSTKKRGDINK